MDRLRDRVIIVTGGAQGIGRAYCEAVAREGARVVVADIAASSAEALARELEAAGTPALGLALDVADPEATRRMASATVERFGRIDGLVNNAAMFQRPAVSRAPFDELSIEEWDRVMLVNVRGVLQCCQAVAPYLREQRYGKIVNISSTTVMHGTPMMAHYVTSKAAVIGLTRVLARELGEFNVCVNAVAPGLTLSLDDPSERLVETHQQRAAARSLKRVQRPDDLVGTIVFLCSPDSDFMTGQTLAVDGGAIMY